jgi:two-component system phosphate regulon response regulator PhoB
VAETPWILATDDETGMLSLYRHMLESEGLRLYLTVDSWEALEICRTQPIALIISDIMKPHMNGLEMVAELRADPRTRHIPVIFVSARADSAEAAFRLGAASFIHKPFHPLELMLEIRRVLRSAAV